MITSLYCFPCFVFSMFTLIWTFASEIKWELQWTGFPLKCLRNAWFVFLSDESDTETYLQTKSSIQLSLCKKPIPTSWEGASCLLGKSTVCTWDVMSMEQGCVRTYVDIVWHEQSCTVFALLLSLSDHCYLQWCLSCLLNHICWMTPWKINSLLTMYSAHLKCYYFRVQMKYPIAYLVSWLKV